MIVKIDGYSLIPNSKLRPRSLAKFNTFSTALELT
jgi:hypothetical protein